MTIRFVDLFLDKKNISDAEARNDFVVRERRPLWQTISIIFVAVLPIAITLSFFVKDTVIFAEILFVLLFSLGVYVAVIVQRSRDLVLATEFQNALFSSALSHSNKFFIIIKSDGSIVHIDRSFQEMFPEFYKEPRRAVDVLLEHGKVSKEDRKIIYSAIEKNGRGKVVFDITDARNQKHRILMTIEPIARPKGFMLLRGREFIEKRVTGPELSHNSDIPVFNDNNMGMFSYLMDSMDLGAYITDLFGHINYANLTLEQWLDFDENEISANNLPLRNIISQNGLDIFVDELKNFEGEVLLQRKVGGQIKAFLIQKSLYDSQGNIIGYIAITKKISIEKETIKTANKDIW